MVGLNKALPGPNPGGPEDALGPGCHGGSFPRGRHTLSCARPTPALYSLLEMTFPSAGGVVLPSVRPSFLPLPLLPSRERATSLSVSHVFSKSEVLSGTRCVRFISSEVCVACRHRVAPERVPMPPTTSGCWCWRGRSVLFHLLQENKNTRTH